MFSAKWFAGRKDLLLRIELFCIFCLVIAEVCYVFFGHQCVSALYRFFVPYFFGDSAVLLPEYQLFYRLDYKIALGTLYICSLGIFFLGLITEKKWLWLFPIGLALCLFAFLSNNYSVWLDEAYTIVVATYNVRDICHTIANDNGPPLFYLLLSVWVRFFGISESAARVFPAISYILSCAGAYLFVRYYLKNRDAALLCFFLCVISPLAVRNAQLVRTYSLLGFLSLLSIIFFVRIVYDESRKKCDLLFYSIVTIVGTFTHYWFFFVLVAQIIVGVLLYGYSLIKRLSIAAVVCVLPFCFLWGPVVLKQIHNQSQLWISVVHPFKFFPSLWWTVQDFWGRGAFLILVLGFFKIEFIRSAVTIQFNRLDELREFICKKENAVFLLLAAVMLFVPLSISLIKPIFFPGRYAIIALFPLTIFLSLFAVRFINKRLLICICLGIFISSTKSFIAYKTCPYLTTDRSAASYVIKTAGNDDIMFFTNLSRMSMEYYFRVMRPDNAFVKFSFPEEVGGHLGWMNPHKMIEQKEALYAEADMLIASIQRDSNRGIWLFYGGNRTIADILKQRCEQEFVLVKEQFLGTFSAEKAYLYRAQ